MPSAPTAFEFVCAELERSTSLERLVARGTVRIALKRAGLEARTVTAQQLAVVAEQILPEELATRGVEKSEEACAVIRSGLATWRPPAEQESDLRAPHPVSPGGKIDRDENSF